MTTTSVSRTPFVSVDEYLNRAERIYVMASLPGKGKNTPLIDVTPRTVQCRVDEIPEYPAEQTGNEDWLKVSAHDLRRASATHTYYSLIAEGGTTDMREVVIQ